LQSIRFFFRGRTSERGYVLVSAIVLAVLYFGLMELMLIDSQRALREAQRFRARIVATTLAESAAELAAAQLVTSPSATLNATDEQGTMTATMTRSGKKFALDAHAQSTGVPPQKASVQIEGEIEGTKVSVSYSYHTLQ
jgi:ABC-type Na+ efflux pump permease subunit